jgi:hypothetical protein
MNAPLLKVDLDVGDPEPSPPLPRQPWSIGSLGVPLLVAIGWLISSATLGLWLGRQSDKLDTVIEQQREMRAEVYKQADAVRDLALRDQMIAELRARMQWLEHPGRAP